MIDAATAPTVAPRRLGPAVLAGLAVLGGVLLVILMGMIGAIFGLRPQFSGGSGPSGLARAEIPAEYLRLYVQAGQRYGIDPWVLAAIGSIESTHGRSRAPGVHSGVNAYGCCAGPMQFSVVGTPSTWDSYGVDGDHDGRRSPYDPADAIPAAAKYLRASGAPRDYRAALFAYNHADWYVAQVLATADRYRGAPTILPPFQPPQPANARAVLDNPRNTLTPLQRSDLRLSAIDPRVISVLAWIGRRHSITVTALKSDHSYLTASGNVSNHSAGRAVDIAIVDGEPCRGTRTGKCAAKALISHHHGGATRWYCQASNLIAVQASGSPPAWPFALYRGSAAFAPFGIVFLLTPARAAAGYAGAAVKISSGDVPANGSSRFSSFSRNSVLPGPSTRMRTGAASRPACSRAVLRRWATTTLDTALSTASSAGLSLGSYDGVDHIRLRESSVHLRFPSTPPIQILPRRDPTVVHAVARTLL